MNPDHASLAIDAPRATLHAPFKPSQWHLSDRVWLRAAVLGASDGIAATASLVVGVAAAHAAGRSILVTGVAGLVAGAMSMAAGEYAAMHARADAERAGLARERREHAAEPGAGNVGRGLWLATWPVRAALAAAASFALGAALPLAVIVLAPASALIAWVFATSLAFLAMLGGIAAQVGGADAAAGARRVAFWGALAMAITAGVGALFGAVA